MISFIRFNEFSFFSTTFLLEKVDEKKKKEFGVNGGGRCYCVQRFVVSRMGSKVLTNRALHNVHVLTILCLREAWTRRVWHGLKNFDKAKEEMTSPRFSILLSVPCSQDGQRIYIICFLLDWENRPKSLHNTCWIKSWFLSNFLNFDLDKKGNGDKKNYTIWLYNQYYA